MNSHLSILFFIICGSFAHQLNSRSVSRSGEFGSVSLVEFNVKGTIYGRCTYRVLNEMITVTYEENDDNLVAKVDNPIVENPVENARECRNQASQKPTLPNEIRSDVVDKTPETELELYSRLKDYEITNAQNQQYVDSLKPKILGFLSSSMASSGFGSYGISFGSSGSSGGLNIGLPTIDKNNFGATIGSGSFFNWFGKKRR